MDALIAKADALGLASRKRKASTSEAGPSSKPDTGKNSSSKKSRKPKSAANDATARTVLARTQIPRSLRATENETERKGRAYGHVGDKRLRAHLSQQSSQATRAKGLADDWQELVVDDEAAGGIKTEDPLERTWRISQEEIVKAVGGEAASSRREWKLDGGSYRMRYTRNGRHVAIVGKKGHVATFDWQAGTLHSELQLQEVCRDVTFLHDHSMYAVAQAKYVYIYDQNGVELHRLTSHIEPTRLEFLPYHWLLVSVGMPGFLKYQDTSTGQIVVEHRTKLGACHTMAQNPHNAVIHLGHQNGTVTLWTPNMSTPAVRLLAHLGPVASIAVDPSHSAGRYMATAGADGRVKLWDCRNWKGCIREWTTRGAGGHPEVEFSAKGHLATISSGSVNVYGPNALFSPHKQPVAPPLYLTHPLPQRPLTGVRFVPYQDVLTIGHAGGLSSILVPGSGEPQFDSREADPFEGRRTRREREVRGLLDKIPTDMIALDPEFVGSLAAQPKETESDARGRLQAPFLTLPRMERLKVSGKVDASEEPVEDDEDANEKVEDREGGDEESGPVKRVEKVRRKARGRETALKRYLKKKRKNVIDPSTEALRAKVEAQKQARLTEKKKKAGTFASSKPSVLDRFK
ncbi:WD40 repeat-like protein [Auriculariales sp. MPI-PUGE-AT-0066]|nr:WD40 repeat-like protein [Auriculariales sp. MPI-PUGE-AT-0066]